MFDTGCLRSVNIPGRRGAGAGKARHASRIARRQPGWVAVWKGIDTFPYMKVEVRSRPEKHPVPVSEEEKEAAKKLGKPSEDKREVTIAPGKGPDVTIE